MTQPRRDFATAEREPTPISQIRPNAPIRSEILRFLILGYDSSRGSRMDSPFAPLELVSHSPTSSRGFPQ